MSDPCINWRGDQPVACGHTEEEHDEDGCTICECSMYRTDGADE